MGPFTGSYRDKLVDKWTKVCNLNSIAISDRYSLVQTLGDPVEIRSWSLCSLPSDQVSIDNGILATQSKSFSLWLTPYSISLAADDRPSKPGEHLDQENVEGCSRSVEGDQAI